MREEGYYWVELYGEWYIGKYIIGEEENEWFIDGAYYYESTLDEVNENQIKRE
jgi:hypothetical protein